MNRICVLCLFGGLVALMFSGCFSGKFVSKYDKFTGVTTKDGRIGWISNTLHTYAVHAHAVGPEKKIHVYVLNASPTSANRLDMLAGQDRVNLRCLYVRDGQKGHLVYRLFACDLTPQQITTLTQARSLQLRVNGATTTASTEQLANIGKVFN